MPKHIHKIKDFLLTVRGKDARSMRIKRTKDDAVKFKERVGADQEDQGRRQVQGALLHVPLHALRLRRRQSQQAQAVPPTRDGKVASEIDMLSLPYYIPPFSTMVVVAGGYSKVDVAIRITRAMFRQARLVEREKGAEECPPCSGKKKKEVKKETKLGMAYKKDDKFGEWYSEVHFLAYHSGLVRFIYKSIWAYGGLVGAM
ncbi:ribosomal protein [Hordeum vulgare]|nr:ribosomal protein [Hordeum vulgare]